MRSVAITEIVDSELEAAARYARWLEVVSEVVAALDEQRSQVETGEAVALIVEVTPPNVVSPARRWIVVAETVAVPRVRTVGHAPGGHGSKSH